MDLNTFNVVSPDPLLNDMGDGLYWSIKLTTPVRLRIMPIDSDAGLCAVFFD